MDRQQKIELLRGILEGNRSITEVAEKHLWMIIEVREGIFRNPDTGKNFAASEYEKELQAARQRHIGKWPSVLRITSRGYGKEAQDTLEFLEYRKP